MELGYIDIVVISLTSGLVVLMFWKLYEFNNKKKQANRIDCGRRSALIARQADTLLVDAVNFRDMPTVAIGPLLEAMLCFMHVRKIMVHNSCTVMMTPEERNLASDIVEEYVKIHGDDLGRFRIFRRLVPQLDHKGAEWQCKQIAPERTSKTHPQSWQSARKRAS